MISADCDWIRDDLDGFADGELRGEDLRRLSQHLEGCRRCSEEVEVRQALGGLIRESLAARQPHTVPAGLASGVVARVRAESALSWRAMIDRAVEDWHWVIVGGGAVTATFASMLFCSALLIFGTAAPSDESLSSLGTNLRASPGALYAEVGRQGESGSMMLVQLETSASPSQILPAVLTLEGQERLWVDALSAALAGSGPLVELASMSESDQRRTEWLLDNITRRYGMEPMVGPLTALTVYRLHLITNTEVTAKGLTP